MLINSIHAVSPKQTVLLNIWNSHYQILSAWLFKQADQELAWAQASAKKKAQYIVWRIGCRNGAR